MNNDLVLSGFARRCVTPQRPCMLAGYMRERWNKSVRDDLFVRALALSANGASIAIVSIDVIWLSRSLAERVRAWAKDHLDLQGEHLLLAATHSHSGPEIRENSFYAPQIDFTARAAIFSACCEALREAFGSLQPATISASQGTLTGTVNRRKEVVRPLQLLGGRPSRQILNLPNPKGARDERWSALWISMGGRTVAVLTCACHPTFLRADAVSADFPGELERSLRSTGVDELVFLQGCSGNVVPDTTRRRPFPWQNPLRIAAWLFDRHQFAKPGSLADGENQMRAFAAALIEQVAGAPRRPLNAVRPAGREVTLALETDPQATGRLSQDPQVGAAYADWVEAHALAGRPAQPFHVQRLAIGAEHSIVAFEGEMFAEYAAWLRTRTPSSAWLAIVSCANGMVGYIPTRAALAEGGYESDRTQMMNGLPGRMAADTEERVRRATSALLDDVLVAA